MKAGWGSHWLEAWQYIRKVIMRISIGQQGQRRLCWPCTFTYIMVGVGIPAACWGKVWERGLLMSNFSVWVFFFFFLNFHSYCLPWLLFFWKAFYLHVLLGIVLQVPGLNQTDKKVVLCQRFPSVYVCITGHQLATKERKMRKNSQRKSKTQTV